jgi:signal transduction histidine kinase
MLEINNQVNASAFQTLVETIGQTVELPACVWVLDQHKNYLVISASVELPYEYVVAAQISVDEGGAVSRAFRQGKAAVVKDVLQDPHWKYKETASEAGWRSVLCVPINLEGDVIGVLSVYTPVVRGFSELEKVLLTDYASQIVLSEEMREEVVAAKQLATLGTAIAALQHRINNTFNIIVPNVMRLRNRVDMTDETVVEILDIIERNARYTSNILSRIQEPLREVEVQDVDVNAVLDEVADMANAQWPGVNIELDLDDSIPLSQASIGQVTEVFRNLVDNACRAMDGKGKISLSSSMTEDRISVRVRDTGPGIPPRIQERLFQKPVSSKKPGEGAGLGLWLSQLMLQTIGGRIEIEKTDSTGTTVLVQIPVAGREGG